MKPGPVIAAVRKLAGDNLDTYLCVDVETSGLSTARDYVLQIGHCAVKNGQVVDRQSFFLDWRRAKIDRAVLDWLQQRVYVTELNMTGKGSPKPINWELLCREGVDPVEALSLYRDWFREMGKMPLVLHNGWAYDTKILAGHFLQFLPEPDYWFDDNTVIDTGSLLKASQTGVLPKEGETLEAYGVRASREGGNKVRWSLHDFAVPYFNLAERHHFDRRQAHDAQHDAWVTHLLLQELIQLGAHEQQVSGH